MSNRRQFDAEHRDPHGVDRGVEVTEQEVRDARATDREHDDLSWSHGSNLSAPPPRPGFVQQWIRYEVGGQVDRKNLQRKLGAERWKPRQADTVPEGYSPATTKHSELGNIIAVAEMVLCERPVHVQRQRDAFYRDRLARQHQGIEANLFKESHPLMPVTQERRSSVELVKRKTAVQSDE